ncbi:MAG: STAS domain-containing protein [Giesbergeria sp.]|nr:STAS domain-containing protein [Giesbergeria sp.]MBP8028582.1 STAS domain-containing protein [Giesbergeria sp.]MBP8840142.1 STAS domain-containing protein [Giesbergeria sp.]
MTTGQMLRIEGEFTIYRAMELKPVLFAQPPVTEIDLSGVTEFDSSGLQLLMLAKKTAVAQGRALVLLGRSPVVVEVFELLGVAGYFDDPLTIRSNANAAVRSSDGS